MIHYNAPLKGNQVRDDCNIEITNDPYFLLNTITSLLYSEQLGLERHTISVIIQYNSPLT